MRYSCIIIMICFFLGLDVREESHIRHSLSDPKPKDNTKTGPALRYFFWAKIACIFQFLNIRLWAIVLLENAIKTTRKCASPGGKYIT